MRLATIKCTGSEKAAIVTETGLVTLEAVNARLDAAWSCDLLSLLQRGELSPLNEWYREGGGQELIAQLEKIPFERAAYAPLYRNPPKIWGIGANYSEKAAEMAVTPPEMEPICFMKPTTSLIGPGDAILLPDVQPAHRVTAEAEIGIVIGAACKYVPEADACKVIAGFTPTLDMTAQDVHARNPRFLGRSKCFDTFFSFGPHLVTPDECPDGPEWTVETVLGGETVHRSDASHMIYSIPFIVSYFSRMMTLLPGDVIMTGTPGSVPLRPQDRVECRIGGFEPLANVVEQEYPQR